MNTDTVLSLAEARRGWLTVLLASGPLLLPHETVRKHGLAPGSPADGEALREEAAVLQTADARRYTNRYLAGAERSSGQLQGKLEARGYLPEVVRSVMDWAREYGLINDLRYARAFAFGRVLGSAGLRARLRERGVDESVIGRVVPEASRVSPETLVAEVRKRYGSLSDPLAARRRAAGWLMRRGFSSSVIAEVLNRVF